MNNSKITTWALLVLVIIAACVFVIARSHTKDVVAPVENEPTTPTSTVVNYYCEAGDIVATYQEGTASIALSDGRTLSLTQAVSASGVRYEAGTDAFITKGSNAYLMEGDKTTYANCIAGSRSAMGESYSFIDGGKLFSFMYPKAGSLSATMGYDINWRQNTDKSGLLLAQVVFPKSSQPEKTNFSDARFTVGTSSDPDAVKTCLTDNMGASGAGTMVTINDVRYAKLTSGDAGAGNLYETTSYRTVRSGQCYAIEYSIHSTQLGNYPASAGIKAYDKAAVTSMLEGIVQSFKFI